MKIKNQYHIDVTSDEDALFRDIQETPKSKWPSSMNFNLFKNSMFWVVFGVHIVVLSVIGFAAKPNMKEPMPEMVGIEDKVFLEASTPTPTPTPMPTPLANNDVPMDGKPPKLEPPKPTPKPLPKNINQQSNTIKNDSLLIKEYTVKQGDTIYSVAKKYKLNYDRLLKINNIQDPNKIKLGQKLKFM